MQQSDNISNATISSGLAPVRRKFWFGPDGLKTGWAVLGYLLIVFVAVIALGTVAHFLHLDPPNQTTLTPPTLIVGEVIMICVSLLATFIMSRVDRRSWLSYGLQGSRRATRCAQGLLTGLGLMIAVMLTLAALHAVRIDSPTGDLRALLQSGAWWALAFALVGATEEITFRGYLYFRLLRGTGPALAAIITSIIFALGHLTNHGETAFGLTQVFLFGVVFCISIWRTGSLWWGIGFHAAWDWSQTFLFGVPDSGLVASGHCMTSTALGPTWLSGGSVGPEGSVLIVPALCLVAAGLVWFVKADSQPVRAW